MKATPGKHSAAPGFDPLLDKALKSDHLTMTISDDCPTGAIPTSALRIRYSGGVVHDADDLLAHLPLIGKALKRKEHRDAILGDEFT